MINEENTETIRIVEVAQGGPNGLGITLSTTGVIQVVSSHNRSLINECKGTFSFQCICEMR